MMENGNGEVVFSLLVWFHATIYSTIYIWLHIWEKRKFQSFELNIFAATSSLVIVYFNSSSSTAFPYSADPLIYFVIAVACCYLFSRFEYFQNMCKCRYILLYIYVALLYCIDIDIFLLLSCYWCRFVRMTTFHSENVNQTWMHSSSNVKE